ncbi:MAG: hypothetical protein A3H63_00020 [Candidatus Harrisonbacteria bacterium RIFCSPLOWO2_02_FULL_45_10c]|uniref:Uncharacterized protein n=1 Tax=Candidatus Harrisonbacteria bacterium RIFCSPLOWO2_02_FULL_45_10c TaxID=1798410 RepID=A0A1G1ZVP9_9BACT|nr:MAG: hypothetical protein A3H63_00020 [Candidatus Harrisonbacteria bacterium RIFCSPLOWO2_02_FULL_45_10c]
MSVEHSALEKDMERLSKEIRERKESSANLRTSDRDALQSVLAQRIQSQALTPEEPAAPENDVLPVYLQKESPEIQLKVEELIDITFHKGIDASISEAKKYGPYILDAFHDTLTSKLYDELRSRGLVS